MTADWTLPSTKKEYLANTIINIETLRLIRPSMEPHIIAISTAVLVKFNFFPWSFLFVALDWCPVTECRGS